MPLNLLIPSLRRVNVPSSSSDTSVHPMHALLEPIMLTTPDVDNKYNVELPLILSEGGGAGEMEETMMWYSLTHEKGDHSEHSEGPWTDDVWRQGYMERMERREVQIQILLFFYKLSLPGPAPPEKKTKKRKRNEQQPMMTRDHLEAFMDRLSMWQLLSTIEQTRSPAEERDWIQTFFENIVEPAFKVQLPDLCTLLRSKVFPSSPFSDDEDESEPQKRKSSSPAPRSLSRAPSTSQTSSPSTSKSILARSRSRSLSVSLAQEQKERERASSIPAKKPAFTREISMSRVFKPKPKPQPAHAEVKTVKTEAPKAKIKPVNSSANLGVILVEETPAKPAKANSKAAITLVEDSPVKPRVAPSTAGQRQSTLNFKRSKDLPIVIPESPIKGTEEDDGEEEWMMASSPPDIVFLNPTRDPDGVAEMNGSDDDERVLATPSKPSRSRSRLSLRKM
uniref:DNA replication regulator Sld3 C-terminal domain-containing protein n=1 Tax=Psilocybe cubensis TaxID=181762 RepID=A0A8H7XWD1_PSICU